MSDKGKTGGEGCAWSARLGAYHDGELSAHEAGLVRAHLADCRRCAAELAELRRIFEVLCDAYSPALPAEKARGMAARAFGGGDALVPTACVLTACAAVMLVVFSLLAMAVPAAPQPARDFDAEAAAVSLDEPGELAVDADYELASWIVADLSGGR